MAKSNYFKKDEFIEYVRNSKNYKEDRHNRQIPGYIGSILDNVLTPLGCGVLIEDIKEAIYYKNSHDKVFKGLELIYDFCKKLYWISKYFPDKIEPFLTEYDLNIASVNAWPTAINQYIDFLKTLSIKQRTSPKYSVSNWNMAMKRLEEIIMDKLSFKGTDSLIQYLPTRDGDNFIHKVLQDSYFFSTKLAKTRFVEISKDFKSGKQLYARKSKARQDDNSFFYNSEINEDYKSIPIIKDSDGNKEVKNMIEKETGYTVSGGYDSLFQYYIISHIWGEAYDPRNFTNFWNIVIVPAWANFLLDKHGSDDELTKMFINTFKAICIKHYQMEDMNWQSIDKDIKNLKPNVNYIVPGTYNINVISKKRKGNDYGTIEKVEITI